ncbi:MAG: hypothetical protein IJZ93_03375 [Clostridia bacterium]|nr:hypothetical protein [Clostridia bacterium]
MKRVKSACIYQTLCFLQKPEYNFPPATALEMNRAEYAKYKADMDKVGTRYQILEEPESPDGSITVKVRKHYNKDIDVGEYFN